MWAAIAGLIGIVALVLRWYLFGRDKQEAEYERDMEQFHKALGSGDVDAISALFDELRAENPGDLSGSDDPKTPERKL